MITTLLGAGAILLPLFSAQVVPNVAGDAVIRLERTACGGECPVYVVTIDAAGNVAYDGVEHVRVKGRQTDRIPVERVAAILDAARRLPFFELADRYRFVKNADGTDTYVTDLPTIFVTISESGRSKRVEDYYGAPSGLKQLEREIDDATRVQRWTFIDEPMIEQLTDEGWRPGRDELAVLLQKAVEQDEPGIVKRLLDLGADANFGYSSGWTLLMSTRSVAAVRLLVAAGADPNARSLFGATPLGMSVEDAPEVAEALLKAGARADQAFDSDGRTPLWQAATAGNAGLVKLLLAAGANPLVRVSGRSALELATERRDAERLDARWRPPSEDKHSYIKDFDAVIALLTQAIRGRRVP